MKWGKIFGQGNAAAFDTQGFPYYTSRGLRPLLPGLRRLLAVARGRDRHDLRDGRELRRRRGVPAPGRDAAHARHAARSATSSRATRRSSTAVSKRTDLLLDYHAFRRTAIEEGLGGATRAFVLPVDRGSDARRRARARRSACRESRCPGRRRRSRRRGSRTSSARCRETARSRRARGSSRSASRSSGSRRRSSSRAPRSRSSTSTTSRRGAFRSPTACPCFEVDQPPAGRARACRRRRAAAGRRRRRGDATVGWLLDGSKAGSLFALADLAARGSPRPRREEAPHDRRPRSTRAARCSSAARSSRGTSQRRLQEIGAEAGVLFKPLCSGLCTEGIDLGSGSFAPGHAAADPPPRPERASTRRRSAPPATSSTRSTTFPTASWTRTSFDRDGPLDGDARSSFRTAGRRPRSRRSEALKKFMNDGGVVVALGIAAFALAAGTSRTRRREAKEASPSIRAGTPEARREEGDRDAEGAVPRGDRGARPQAPAARIDLPRRARPRAPGRVRLSGRARRVQGGAPLVRSRRARPARRHLQGRRAGLRLRQSGGRAVASRPELRLGRAVRQRRPRALRRRPELPRRVARHDAALPERVPAAARPEARAR